MATQNPIEQEGTYPLPEAQVDRFMLMIKVGYPSREEERKIMDRMTALEPPKAEPVVTPAELLDARKVVKQVYIDDKVKDYIVDVVFATREPAKHGLKDLAPLIEYGASPRASIALNLAARAHAFLRHRGYVTPEDVKAIGPDVLRHRVVLTYEAEAEEVTERADRAARVRGRRGPVSDTASMALRLGSGVAKRPLEARRRLARALDRGRGRVSRDLERRRTKPIPTELLKQLRTIEIHTARLANEQLVGHVHVELQGPGPRLPRGARRTSRATTCARSTGTCRRA